MFDIHTPETAPEGSKDMLENLQSKFGFLPNLFGVMAESPAMLEAYPTLNRIFEKSELTPVEQMTVQMAASVENECKFCMAAHSTVMRNKLDASDEVIDAIRDGRDIPDEKLDALYKFTRKVVQSRGTQSDADIQAFLDAGYTRGNVLDVILGVALKTLTNYTNHLIDTPVNEQFAAEKWDPSQKKAA